MEPGLFSELERILLKHRSEALDKLRDLKREGRLVSADFHMIITEVLNPRRTEPRGGIVGLHTQLARTRFADCGVPDREARGTPPQRHSWRLDDRRHEPIRRGSPEWAVATAKRRFHNDKKHHNDDAKSASVEYTEKPLEAEPVQDPSCVENVEAFFEQALLITDSEPVESIDRLFEEGLPDESLPAIEQIYSFDRQTPLTQELVTAEKSAIVSESAPAEEASDPFAQYLEAGEDDDEDDANKSRTQWGRAEGGRNRRHRDAARLRCASRQPSSLRSSWTVAQHDGL